MSVAPASAGASERLERVEAELARIGREEAFKRGEVMPDRASNETLALRAEHQRLERVKDVKAKSRAIEQAEQAEHSERQKREKTLARMASERRKVEDEIGELQTKVTQMLGNEIALSNTTFESDRLRELPPGQFREGIPQ